MRKSAKKLVFWKRKQNSKRNIKNEKIQWAKNIIESNINRLDQTEQNMRDERKLLEKYI